MSAVLPRAASLDSTPRGVAGWIRAWSKMGRQHAMAWLLSSAAMTVVDLTALIDKLDKPGVSLSWHGTS